MKAKGKSEKSTSKRTPSRRKLSYKVNRRLKATSAKLRRTPKNRKGVRPNKMNNKKSTVNSGTNEEILAVGLKVEKMEEIWMSACRNLEISDDIARPWYERIRQKMVQGSGRFYHNWDELLLRKEDYLRGVSSSIVFAVFFQYYEFDGKRNCVKKNCEAFEEFCSNSGLKDENIVKLVKKLLGDETIDDIPGSDDDANLLQDLDLLVLGSPPEEYKLYRELLRKEYSHLDENSYKQMRLKVLQTFLMIPTIFATKEFQSKFEETARTNIQKEIEELKN